MRISSSFSFYHGKLRWEKATHSKHIYTYTGIWTLLLFCWMSNHTPKKENNNNNDNNEKKVMEREWNVGHANLYCCVLVWLLYCAARRSIIKKAFVHQNENRSLACEKSINLNFMCASHFHCLPFLLLSFSFSSECVLKKEFIFCSFSYWHKITAFYLWPYLLFLIL